ncbi:MAG: TrmO family methyltransferase domain-containing protein [Halobacteriota archaeon]
MAPFDEEAAPIALQPIGRIDTPIENRSDAPRQGFRDSIEGTIQLVETVTAGLAGYEAGDEILIVWFADDADRTVLTTDRHGRGGVFTTRSPARPNPICLSVCTIVSIDVSAGQIVVRGVDMFDGSPILDLKPPIDR